MGPHRILIIIDEEDFAVLMVNEEETTLIPFSIFDGDCYESISEFIETRINDKVKRINIVQLDEAAERFRKALEEFLIANYPYRKIEVILS